MILTPGTFLYHGSYTEVREPELSRCNPFKDFGRGFYLTTSPAQAASFVRSAVAKAAARGDVPTGTYGGYVSSYRFVPAETLRVFEFTAADAEWLHCIAAHRRENLALPWLKRWSEYDILVGKVANDRTNPTITAYLAGLFGEVGSAEADERCVSMLLPEKLENQIYLRTEAALQSVKFTGSEEISWQ